MKAFALIALLVASAVAKNEPCGDSVECIILCQEGRFAPIGPLFFGGPPRFGCSIGLSGALAANAGASSGGNLMAKACGSTASNDRTVAACKAAGGKICEISQASSTGCILSRQNFQRFDNACGMEKPIVIANGFSENDANKFCDTAS